MAANKLVLGTFGDDTLIGGTGNDTLLGSGGNDTLVVTSGSDYYDGGSGFDILDGSSSSQALTINLATGTMTGPGTSLVFNVEEVIGSGKSDNITGSWLSETFYGGAGSDTISGGGGNDFTDGGTSSDRLDGGDGQDTVYGGDSNDVINGGQGDDKLYGDAGNDTIDGGDNNDRLYGGSSNDTVNGGTGDDYIEGGDGGDTLHGNDGNDIIIAGSGADKVYGDYGDDRLVYDKTAATGYTQVFDGGYGNDTIEVHLTRAQLTSAVQAEIDKFQAFAANSANAGKTFKFTTLGNLQVTNVEKLTLIVDDANTAPVIDGSQTTASLTVAHNGTASGQVVATDANGDALTYSVATAAQHGTVTFTGANGQYTYTAGDYVGPDSFTIQVSDGHDGTTTQTVNVGVTNTGPAIDILASTTAFDVAHDQSYSGQVVVTDADGDALTYTVVGAPEHGTVTFSDMSGNWVFQADGAFDTDSFTIQVSDGHGGVSTLTVAVTDPNTAPMIDPASDATLSVAHNHTVSGVVAATDAENDALTFSLATGPSHGTVTFTDAHGHYTYTAGDYIGADSFTIAVTDGYGGLTTHTVTVDIGNTGPAIDTDLTTQALIARGVQPMSGVLVANDADGDQLTYSASGAQHGTVAMTGAAGGYTYLSDGLAGTDSFTVTASDGHGGLVEQIVSVTTVGTLVAAQGATSAMTVDLSAHTATNAAGDVNYAVDVTGSALADRITGDAAANVLSGGLANDTIAGGEGADTLDGGDGNDALNGGGGTDVVYGGSGNDGIYGGGANDAIYGNDGNDRIFGDGGNDVIFAGAGNDTMTGGQSNGLGGDFADTFGWTRSDVVKADGTSAGLDHITDFGVTDRLDFTGLFNDTHPASIASLVHVFDTSAGTVVSADVGGGHFMDVVVLDNVHNLTIDDLLHNHQVVV